MFITSIIRMKFRRFASKDKQKETRPGSKLLTSKCCLECAKDASRFFPSEAIPPDKSDMDKSNNKAIEMDLLASNGADQPRKRLQRVKGEPGTVHSELTELLRSLSSVVHLNTGQLLDDEYGGKLDVGAVADPNIKRAWGSTRVTRMKEPNGFLVGAGAGAGKPVTPRNPKSKRVPVDIRIAFIKIIDVDTLKQRFKADICVQAIWEEPALKGVSQKDLDNKFTHGNYWNPELFIPNMSGLPERDDTWYVAKAREVSYSNPVICMKRRVKAYFNERMELRDFPLDVQELHIKIASRKKETEVEIAEDMNHISLVNTATFTDANEFSLYKHVESGVASINSRFPQDTKKHPLIEFNVSVKRNIGFFFWNVVFPMLLISGMMFATYGIQREQYDERLKVNILLVLSIVALKFVVSKGLPKIPYMTYLDVYVLVSLIVVMMMACQNAILSLYKGNKARMKSFDVGSAWFFLAIYLLIQFVCAVLLGIALAQQKEEMDKKENDYKRKVENRNRHMTRTEGDFGVMVSGE